jgi:hypothetical protein
LAAETVLYGKPLDRSAKFLSAMLDTFSPVGGAATPLQVLAPTVVDPLVALSENKDWTGKPVYREDFNKLHPTTGLSRARDSATPWARGLAEVINYALGGTEYTPGLLSPTPDAIDFLIGSATGGLGREVAKTAGSLTGAMTGEEVPLWKIPLVGRFVGTAGGEAGERTQFYENLTTLNMEESELKGRIRNREDASGYLREHPEVRLAKQAERIQREVSQLEKRKREMIRRGVSDEQVRLMTQQITARMRRLNQAVEAAAAR